MYTPSSQYRHWKGKNIKTTILGSYRKFREMKNTKWVWEGGADVHTLILARAHKNTDLRAMLVHLKGWFQIAWGKLGRSTMQILTISPCEFSPSTAYFFYCTLPVSVCPPYLGGSTVALRFDLRRLHATADTQSSYSVRVIRHTHSHSDASKYCE